MRMSPMLGSPCWYSPEPMAAPLSATTLKLTLVYWAQFWAAVMMAFCHVWVDQRALNFANMSLVPFDPLAICVPSGTKLSVTSSGWIQALLVRAYGTMRDSSISREGRASSGEGRVVLFPVLFQKKRMRVSL